MEILCKAYNTFKKLCLELFIKVVYSHLRQLIGNGELLLTIFVNKCKSSKSKGTDMDIFSWTFVAKNSTSIETKSLIRLLELDFFFIRLIASCVPLKKFTKLEH